GALPAFLCDIVPNLECPLRLLAARRTLFHREHQELALSVLRYGAHLLLANPERVPYPSQENLVALLRLLLDHPSDQGLDLVRGLGYLLPHYRYRLEDALFDEDRVDRYLVRRGHFLNLELVHSD